MLFLLVSGGILTPTSAAEEYYTEGYFKYTISNDSVTIISYFGSESDVVIPDYIAALAVTRIESSTFAGNKTVTAVTIPQTVTSIDDGLFSDMEQLRKIIVQSESITVKAPKGCVIVEDYPVYVDANQDSDYQGSDSSQSGDSTSTQKSDGKDGKVEHESSEGDTENETTNNNDSKPSDNKGDNDTDNQALESGTAQNKTDGKEVTENKASDNETDKTTEGNNNHSENISKDNNPDNGFEVAGDDVEDVISSQDKPGITTKDNNLITADDNYIITDENNNEVTVEQNGDIVSASDDVTELNEDNQSENNSEKKGASTVIIISLIVVFLVIIAVSNKSHKGRR